MLTGSRLFVLAVFCVLALAFVAETAVLIWEFRNAGWYMLVTQDSHNFLFFPTLGLLALAAFYTPASAFTDMYWRYVRFGRARFGLGLLVVASLSWLIASGLDESPYRSIWDISPATLQSDKSEPAGCGSAARPCERLAILEALDNVRIVAETRLGLTDFVRTCEPDALIEASLAPERRRFCFASTPLGDKPYLSTTAECCKAQMRLQTRILEDYGDPGKRSLTSVVHSLVLPFKVFFLLVLGVISVLLALRHRGVSLHYPRDNSQIEVGVIVGAAAMIFFPLMSQAFVETADALYGTAQNQGFKPIVPFMSFAFGAWALLLLMFFYRRHDREVEMAGKIAGVLASAVAIVKYDLIIALVNRFLGSGAGITSILLLTVLSIVGAIVLVSPYVRRKIDDAPYGPRET